MATKTEQSGIMTRDHKMVARMAVKPYDDQVVSYQLYYQNTSYPTSLPQHGGWDI